MSVAWCVRSSIMGYVIEVGMVPSDVAQNAAPDPIPRDARRRSMAQSPARCRCTADPFLSRRLPFGVKDRSCSGRASGPVTAKTPIGYAGMATRSVRASVPPVQAASNGVTPGIILTDPLSPAAPHTACPAWPSRWGTRGSAFACRRIVRIVQPRPSHEHDGTQSQVHV